MANALNRNIKRGEAVILKGHPDRPFIVIAGFGLYKKTSGCAFWGHWQDEIPNTDHGPFDAVTAIDREGTNKLQEEIAGHE